MEKNAAGKRRQSNQKKKKEKERSSYLTIFNFRQLPEVFKGKKNCQPAHTQTHTQNVL